jgi:2,5-diketo-D-gluconate reductase A
MIDVPSVTLNDGRALPRMGLGVWQIPEGDLPGIVGAAAEEGYRLFDGATIYGNEKGLGEGLKRTGLPRKEIFVTTKVWNDHHGFDAALRSVEGSLARLGLERLDLVLIHWPAPWRGLYVDTWKALVRLREEGRVSSIGVSNFRGPELERIIGETGVTPVLNQVELHPELPQKELREIHARLGMVTESWTPLGQGRTFGAEPVVRAAERTGATPAQVLLAWNLALGCVPIPRSTKRERLRENLGALEVRLTPQEVAAIEGLETGHRAGRTRTASAEERVAPVPGSSTANRRRAPWRATATPRRCPPAPPGRARTPAGPVKGRARSRAASAPIAAAPARS